MPLDNCEDCGTLFLKTVSSLCPVCLAAEEEDYEKVRGELRDTPGLQPEELSEKTGVRLDRILKFIRNGSLKARGLTCQRCGVPITEGRYCEECFTAINDKIRSSIAKDPEAGKISKGSVYTAPRFRGK